MLNENSLERKAEDLKISYGYVPVAKLQINLCNAKEQFLFLLLCARVRGGGGGFNHVLLFMKGNIWINNRLLKADTQTECFLYREMS